MHVCKRENTCACNTWVFLTPHCARCGRVEKIRLHPSYTEHRALQTDSRCPRASGHLFPSPPPPPQHDHTLEPISGLFPEPSAIAQDVSLLFRVGLPFLYLNIIPSSSSPVEVVGMLSGPLLSAFSDQPDRPKATDGLPVSHRTARTPALTHSDPTLTLVPILTSPPETQHYTRGTVPQPVLMAPMAPGTKRLS